MHRLRTFLLLAVASLVAASAVAQERGNARLTGKVVDEQGQPVADVQIRAQKVGDPTMFSAKTDKKGEWKLEKLADGPWRIEFAHQGLETNQTTFEVKEQKVAPMTITMAKPGAKVDPTAEINGELQRAAGLAQAGKVADARK